MLAEFIYAPPAGPLDVLHFDDDVLVLNKPSGLLSVPG
ncbi:MAG TPA: RNA pseudouridine synthase, partial [Rhodobacteraceae bacterium]|nr:RNA pseudouridine synthase [Paracoccaceae bacterium]